MRKIAVRFTLAAIMFPDCAFLPVSLLVFAVKTAIGACILTTAAKDSALSQRSEQGV